MNSINDIVDRLQSRVQALIQKVEVLDSENQQLHKRIGELELELSLRSDSNKSVSIETVRDLLEVQIADIDTCIEELRTMK